MKYLRKYNESFTDKLQSEDKDQLIHILTNILNKVHGNELFHKADKNLKELLYDSAGKRSEWGQWDEYYDFFERNGKKWYLNMIRDPNTFGGVCEYISTSIDDLSESKLKCIINEIMEVEGMLEILYRDISIDVNESFGSYKKIKLPNLTHIGAMKMIEYIISEVKNVSIDRFEEILISPLQGEPFTFKNNNRSFFCRNLWKHSALVGGWKIDAIEMLDVGGEYSEGAVTFELSEFPVEDLKNIIRIWLDNPDLIKFLSTSDMNVNLFKDINEKIELPNLTQQELAKMFKYILDKLWTSVGFGDRDVFRSLLTELQHNWIISYENEVWDIDNIIYSKIINDWKVRIFRYNDETTDIQPAVSREDFELSEISSKDLKNGLNIIVNNPDFLKYMSNSKMSFNLFKDINENSEESKKYNEFLMTQDGTIPSDIFLNEYKKYWEKAPLEEIEEMLFSGIFLSQVQAVWNILRRLGFSFEIEVRTLTEFKRWNFILNLETGGVENQWGDIFRISISGLSFHLNREAPEDEPNKIEVILPREDDYQSSNNVIEVESLNDILKPLADRKITLKVKAEVLKDINETKSIKTFELFTSNVSLN